MAQDLVGVLGRRSSPEARRSLTRAPARSRAAHISCTAQTSVRTLMKAAMTLRDRTA